MAMRSIRIRSITERHSLFPRSYTRTPYRLALRLAYLLKEGERYGLTTFHASDDNGLGLSYPPAVIMSVQPHLDRELTDCTPFGSSLQPRFWSEASTSFGLFFVTMFIRHSHWLTIPSSLAPRQNDVICLNLHSRFGLFLSERVLCQSSFAQRDYSQCTYSQTTANGIAGVINELNHSYTITYTAFTCHTPGSKYEVTMLVASEIPAIPLPWAKAPIETSSVMAAKKNLFFMCRNF